MTIETRTTIAPQDIIGIEYDCKFCGAQFLLKIDRAEQRLTVCPVCQKRWVITDPSNEVDAVLNAIVALAELRAIELKNFKVRFQLVESIKNKAEV